MKQSHSLMIQVVLLIVAIIAIVECLILLDRLDNATQYIRELEQVIEDNDITVADVCGGDGYSEWYSRS